MEITNLGFIPKGLDYQASYLEPLASWDIERLESLGLQKAWYWYVNDDAIAGSGTLLALKDNIYYVYDMGHCACGGPTQDLDPDGSYASLVELTCACSAEMYGHVGDLINLALKELGGEALEEVITRRNGSTLTVPKDTSDCSTIRGVSRGVWVCPSYYTGEECKACNPEKEVYSGDSYLALSNLILKARAERKEVLRLPLTFAQRLGTMK